ncbi:peroxisomal biogenesis factor 11 [Dipodascopsis tothii]|uniref:peroxisomal biogenesis factor 11 n=1 Tax=Dipodascopsis tothii TaxID=44089 RepID=UPI0034CFBD21
MVCDTLIYHPSLGQLLKFFDSTVGRDKLMRMVQYWARFYAFHLARSGKGKPAVDKWRSVMAQFALARKMLRVGKPLQHLRAAAKAYDAQTVDPVVRYSAILRQLSYACYLSVDSLLLAHALRVVTLKNPQQASRAYYKFWLAGIVSSVVGGTYRLYGLSRREASLHAQAEKDLGAIKKIRAEKTAGTHQLVLDVLDSSIPLSGLQYAGLDDGTVGVCGFVSSAIGAAAQWKAVA